MTDQDCVFNMTVIDQWIDDLLDKDIGIKFNADVPYALTAKGKLTGDAGLFLAYRRAPENVQTDKEIVEWMQGIDIPKDEDYMVSELLVHTYTRIPLKACRSLLWPQVLLDDPDYNMEKMTAKDFVKTLRAYLETGIVSWSWLLPDEG
jgi:hypothetical protein